MPFKSGSDSALLLLCLLRELEMGLMMAKRSLPESSLLVQTILGALRKPQGDWEAPLSMVCCVGAGRVQHQETKGVVGRGKHSLRSNPDGHSYSNSILKFSADRGIL